MLPEQGEYAYIATLEALKNAGIDQDYINANEIGILYGNDSSAKAVIESIDIIREKKDTMMVGSGSVFQTMNCTVTMNLATIFKLRGINFTISAACASGSHSIGLGYHFIKTGLQDCIVCGGVNSPPLKYRFFDLLPHHAFFRIVALRAGLRRGNCHEKAK